VKASSKEETSAAALTPWPWPKSPEDAAPRMPDGYEIPSWAEFRQFVMDNGNKYVRASYPNPPTDLIESIWCGIPVEDHLVARVMTPRSEWLVY